MSRKKPSTRALAPGVTSLDQLKADPKNRRRRTERGAAMLVDSLQAVGPARSIVVDENFTVLAGNGVTEAARKVGITRVRVVEADGDELIAVQRKGLTPDQKRKLAMFDNRVGELAEWDPEQLAADVDQDLELSQFFNEDELDKMLRDATGKKATVEEVNTTSVADRFWISIRGPLQQQAHALRRLRELMKEIDGVDVELGTIAVEGQW